MTHFSASQPKISIVMPSFNQASYLEASIKSVTTQMDHGYKNVEFIIMDGGSSDDSVSIIRKYEKYLSHWVSQKDGGQTQALIEGFKKSTGDIQCWLNSDDLLAPGSLQKIGSYFQGHPGQDAVFGDSIWIDANGLNLRVQREIPFNRFIWFYTYNYIPSMSMFWRRSLYEKVGGLNAQFNLAMDADLWIRFSDSGSSIGHLRQILSYTRFHPDQKTRKLNLASHSEMEEILRRYHPHRSIPALEQSKRLVARCLRVGWRAATGCYFVGYTPNMEKVETKRI